MQASEVCRLLGSDGWAKTPLILGRSGDQGPCLGPNLAVSAAHTTALCQAQLGAEPTIAVPSGFRRLSWPVLACPELPWQGRGWGWGVRRGPEAPEDCRKSQHVGPAAREFCLSQAFGP